MCHRGGELRVAEPAPHHRRDHHPGDHDADSTASAIGPLITALSSPTSPNVLIDYAAQALSPLGAVGGALIIVDDHGQPTSMSTAGLSSSVAPRLGAAVIDGGFPAMAALRQDESLWLGSREQVARRFPVFSAIPADWQAYAALPLRHGARVVGSAAIPFDRPQQFDDVSRLTIESIAGVLGAAVHATRHTVRHSADECGGSTDHYLLDAMIDGAIVVDYLQDRISYANHAALELLGIDSVAELEMPVGEVARRFSVGYRRPPLPHPGGSSSAVLTLRSARGIDRVLRAHASEIDSRHCQLVVLIDAELAEQPVDMDRRCEMRDALVEDRKRVARDLHDGAIQTVFATSLTLAALALETPEPLRQRIEEAIDGLDQVVTQLRSTVFDLRQRSTAGPASRINELIAAFGTTLPAMPILTVIGDLDELADEPHLVEHLELALREALSNTARHAHAANVAVAVQVGDESVVFSVHDDGIGFDESARTGDGLANLRSRAVSLGGDCRCDSVPGVGTVVHWSLSRLARPHAVDLAHPLAS